MTAAVKLKDACPWKKSYEKSGQGIKNQRHCLSTKVHIVKAMVFPVVMYGCESWIIKKAECQRIDAFELWRRRRLFESPLDCKEIKPVNPEGISLENLPEELMMKLKLLYFGHLMQRADSLENTLMLGKIEGEEKGMTEDETVGCHHRLNGCEFEQALRDGEGQGSLMCNSPWGFRESNMTE